MVLPRPRLPSPSPPPRLHAAVDTFLHISSNLAPFLPDHQWRQALRTHLCADRSRQVREDEGPACAPWSGSFLWKHGGEGLAQPGNSGEASGKRGLGLVPRRCRR